MYFQVDIEPINTWSFIVPFHWSVAVMTAVMTWMDADIFVGIMTWFGKCPRDAK